MKRNGFRKSLQKIKKEIKSVSSEYRLSTHSEDSGTFKNFCTCKDAQGNPKILYSSQKEAREELKFFGNNRTVTLRIYPCPSQKGWHLTKG